MNEQSFTIRWTINMEAPTLEEAVLKTFGVMQDPNSIATFFRVIDAEGKEHFADFWNVLHPEDPIPVEAGVWPHCIDELE